VGETWTITVTTDPVNTIDPVSFASGDTAVAEVSEEGVITAVSTGETEITVTCGSLKATCKVICNIPEETTEATTVPETTETVIQDTGYQAAMLAVEQLGKPYRYGGAGPDDFDASGLLYYCYGQLGISVPRSTSTQATFGTQVTREELKPGDAIFLWSTTPGQPESVAIYIGNSVAIASFNDKRPVFEFNIESNYYTEHFVYGRRFY
jgi:cell wall-associated NlpC family hydrolase